MFAPSYAEMIARAAAASAAASEAMVCRAARLDTPEPLSAVAVMAASTATRLSGVTPESPMAARSAAVSAGVTVLPAAISNIRETMEARAAISAWVLTAVEMDPSMMSLSSAALPVESMVVIPKIVYCEAVSVTSLSLAFPSAPANNAV